MTKQIEMLKESIEQMQRELDLLIREEKSKKPKKL